MPPGLHIPSVLHQPSLVLNESWVALRTVPVRHALHLMATGAAKALDADTFELYAFEQWIEQQVRPQEASVRTVRKEIRAPETIVLTRYKGVPVTLAPFCRRNLFRRDRHTCQYCGSRPGTPELSIDHIVPRSQGGRTSWENCVLSCRRCNHRKRNRTPAQAGMKLLSLPHQPRWTPFFEISHEAIRQSWSRFVRLEAS